MRYLFEDSVLDTERRELLRGANAVPVEPQVFDLLVYLIRNRERVVSRDDLLASVWEGRLVSESALNTRIHLARSAVGDNGEDQRLIRTFPRKGIRFVGAVRQDQGTGNTVVEPARTAAKMQVADTKARAAPPGNGDLVHATVIPEISPSLGKVGATPSQEPRNVASGAGRWQLILRTWQELWFSKRRAAAPAGNPATVGEGGVPASGRRSLRNGLVVVAVSVVLAFGALMLWPWRHAASPPDVLTMMAAPSIAVLPFTTVGSQDEPRSSAPGLEAEVRTELARVNRGFDLVIKSAGDDRDRPASAKLAGSRLGVRYLVAGTTWLDGEMRRANVQLIETETDRQIWSEPFELNRGQNGTVNSLAARIARLLIIQVRTAESRRPLPRNVEAGHYVLLGRALLETERGGKSTSEAQSLFKKALEVDPTSVAALQGFATVRLIQVHTWLPWEQRPSALTEAREAIERLVKLDPGNASGHHLRASLLRALGKPDPAIASLEHALSLNPNYVLAHAELGRVKIDAGRAHEAIAHIEHAIRLSPPEPNIHVLYFWAGLAALHIADDQAAVQWLLKARQANPSFALSTQLLAVAYLGIGEEKKARATLAIFLKVVPEFTIAKWTRWVPTNATVAKQRQRITDALRRLGVPGDETVAVKR